MGYRVCLARFCARRCHAVKAYRAVRGLSLGLAHSGLRYQALTCASENLANPRQPTKRRSCLSGTAHASFTTAGVGFPGHKSCCIPPVPSPTHVSAAQHTDEYRRDAAKHIYQRLPERIYKGKLPPLLKAVVVVDIHIDTTGQVVVIDWVRVPKHSPDVTHDIEQAIRQSAPFPAPHYLKRVNFTETWLWHRSGRFQLNTLTEGQQ